MWFYPFFFWSVFFWQAISGRLPTRNYSYIPTRAKYSAILELFVFFSIFVQNMEFFLVLNWTKYSAIFQIVVSFKIFVRYSDVFLCFFVNLLISVFLSFLNAFLTFLCFHIFHFGRTCIRIQIERKAWAKWTLRVCKIKQVTGQACWCPPWETQLTLANRSMSVRILITTTLIKDSMCKATIIPRTWGTFTTQIKIPNNLNLAPWA